MPVACARCRTANPDGNAFCVNCGSALAAVPTAAQAAPLGAPAAPIPPQPMPGAMPSQQPPPPEPVATQAGPLYPPTYYANPGQTQFYTPPPVAAGGPGPVHRLSRNALIAIIAAAVLVIAGVGAIVALAGKGSKAPVYSPPPVVSSQPVPPTQSSVPTPRPTVSPTQPPGGGGASGAGQPINAGFAQFPALAGFSAQSPQNNSIELDATDNSGQIFVSLEGVTGATTNQQLADALLAIDQKTSPDAARCSSDQAGPTLAGSGGAQIPSTLVVICETYTPQNGQAFKAVDAYFAGLAKDSTGAPSAVVINLFSPQPNFQNFVKEIPNGWASHVQFNATGP